MKRILLALPFIALTAACGSVNPSVVKVVTDRGAFIGETSDSFSGTGEFSVSSVSGTTCSGTFTFINENSGNGTISCSNKRSGTFAFVAEPNKDNDISILKGYGQFKDGQKFVITFDKNSSSELYYHSRTDTERTIYRGKPPAYNGQFEIDI